MAKQVIPSIHIPIQEKDGSISWVWYMFLKYLSSVEGGSGASSLSQLSDVNISSPINNQYLVYDNGIWKNQTLSISWGQIGGDIEDQVDLKNALDSKQNVLTAGTNITIDENNVISATGDSLPDQTGNAGKFLTTDGTDASWGNLKITSTQVIVGTTWNVAPYTVLVGVNSYSWTTSANYGVAVGYTAACYTYSVAVGANSIASGDYSIAIGYHATAPGNNSITIGAEAHSGARNSVCVGYDAETTSNAQNAIQIGSGVNRVANTLMVANGNGNFEMMSADGTIPEARLADTTSATEGQVLTLDANGNAEWADASSGSSYHPDLFDWKWADHQLNDVQWLRADTFSWQSGSVYESAYQHLVDEIYIAYIVDVGSPDKYYRMASDDVDGALHPYAWGDNGSVVYYTDSETPQVSDSLYRGANDSTPTISIDEYGLEVAPFIQTTYYAWYDSGDNVRYYTLSETPSANDTLYQEVSGSMVEVPSESAVLSSYDSSTTPPRIRVWTLGGTESYYRDTSNDITVQSETILTGAIVKTETIAGTTITYYEATDGHKIVLADQESNVSAIYNATGVAWYYIIDTVNERFKLPRTKFGVTGLRDTVGNYVDAGLPNITGSVTGIGSGQTHTYTGAFYQTGTSSGTFGGGGGNHFNLGIDASRSSAIYGNSDTVQSKATQMYLYFYVGEFTQTALENTAGLNAELFNNKVDKGHQVIAFQAPTAQNNYTWYRKYADGWVEQGGEVSYGTTAVTFPVTMASSNYTVNLTQVDGLVAGTVWLSATRATVGLTVYYDRYNRNTTSIAWQVSGMAAQ